MPSSTILGIPSSGYPAPDVDNELAELERVNAELDLELARRRAEHDQAMALRQLHEQMTAIDDECGDSSFLNFPFRSKYAVKLTQKWPKSTAR